MNYSDASLSWLPVRLDTVVNIGGYFIKVLGHSDNGAKWSQYMEGVAWVLNEYSDTSLSWPPVALDTVVNIGGYFIKVLVYNDNGAI